MRPLLPLPDVLPEIGAWVTQTLGLKRSPESGDRRVLGPRTGRVIAVEAPPFRWQWAIRPPRYRVLWRVTAASVGRTRGVSSWLPSHWVRAATAAEIEAAGAWPMPDSGERLRRPGAKAPAE